MKASEKLGGAGGKPTIKPTSKVITKATNVPRSSRTTTGVLTHAKSKSSVVPKRANAKVTHNVEDVKLNTPVKNPPWNGSTSTPPRRVPISARIVPRSDTKPKLPLKPKQVISEECIDTLRKIKVSDRLNTPNADKNLRKNIEAVTSRSVDIQETQLLKTKKPENPSTSDVNNDGDTHVDISRFQRTIREFNDKVRERDEMIERLQIVRDSLQESRSEENKQYKMKIADLESTIKKFEKTVQHLQSETASTSSLATAKSSHRERPTGTSNVSQLECDNNPESRVITRSVARLRNRISIMEETRHSTNEELAATLKELSDSHQCTAELRLENEKLKDQNFTLIDSISHLSEKVSFYKTQTESILGDPSSPASVAFLPDVTNNQRLSLPPSFMTTIAEERDKNQIEELQSNIRSLQDEKEVLMKKSYSLDEHIQQLQQTVETKCSEVTELRQEITNHRVYLDTVMKEKEKLGSELNEIKLLHSSHQTEIQRIQGLYDIVKSKYDDLILQDKLRVKENKQPQSINTTDDFEKVSKQKCQLELELKTVQEDLQEALEKVRILYLEASDLRNELVVSQMHSKEVQKDLEIRLAKSTSENSTLSYELSGTHEKCENEEKKYQKEAQENLRIRNIMCEMELEILQWKQQCESLERTLSQEKSIMFAEREEWQQFQSDLLLVVRSANDFKMEAQETSDRLHNENLTLRERINTLENRNGLTKDDLPNSHNNFRDTFSSTSSVDSRSTDSPDENKDPRDKNNLKPRTLVEIIDTPDVGNKNGDLTVPEDNKLKITTPERRTVFNKAFPRVLNSNSEVRRNSYCEVGRVDPLTALVKLTGGSKRNALLKWCQNKTSGYKYIDITNFSTSWNDGMALCALLHTFIPDKIRYETLTPENPKENFKTAFEAAESINIETSLDMQEMISVERPAWEKVMSYVKDIYARLEGSTSIV